MKIIICSQDYPFHIGGPHVWLSRIIPKFQKEGIDCTVLFTVGGRGEEFKYIHLLRKIGVKCYIYEGLEYTEHKVRWILRIVKSEKPDIFIPDFDIPAYFAARWIREAGIPTVGMIRSDDQLYRSIIDEFIAKPGPFNPTAVVCVSKYLEELTRSKSQNRIIIKRIPSGTPIPEKRVMRKNDALRLIYSGRLADKQKRISDVASALCKTVRAIPGTEAIVYGSGKKKVLKSVLQIMKSEGDSLPVWYGGRVENNQMQEKLLEGHVIVLLSDYEGLPTTLVEAMACGLVPVCTDMRSGIPELIKDGETGLLVSDRGDGFTRAIHRLKHDKELWERISTRARKKVESEYSIHSSIKKWIELLKYLQNNFHHPGTSLSIRKKVMLPDYNPKFERWDQRWPGRYIHIRNKVRTSVNKLVNRTKSFFRTVS